VEPCLEIPDNEPGAQAEDQKVASFVLMTLLFQPNTFQMQPQTRQVHMVQHMPTPPKARTPTPPAPARRRLTQSQLNYKAESRRRIDSLYNTLSDDAKAQVSGIIDEVITESR
jgi:hypothetical protein